MSDDPVKPTASSREPPWTIRRVLAWTVEEFTRRKIDNPRLDADLLLAEALGIKRLQIYLDLDKPLRPEELTAFKALVRRRTERMPISHILGRREFWGRSFHVTHDTLAPRPETELLVEEVLAHVKAHALHRAAIMDVGTGTGCLAITLALEIPDAVVSGVDISASALAVAVGNGQALGANVNFVESDMDAALKPEQIYDVVVSNPPYLTQEEWHSAAPEVRDHEPRQALVGADADGLGHHRALAARFWPRVKAGGGLWAEMGAMQGMAALALWEAAVGQGGHVQVLKDLAGHDRVVRVLKK